MPHRATAIPGSKVRAQPDPLLDIKRGKYRWHQNYAHLCEYDLRQVPVHFELVDGTKLSTVACGHLACEYREDAGETRLAYSPPREWVGSLISKHTTLNITQTDSLRETAELPAQLIRSSNIKQVNFGPEEEFRWFFRIQGRSEWAGETQPKSCDQHWPNLYPAEYLWMEAGAWKAIGVVLLCLGGLALLSWNPPGLFFGVVGMLALNASAELRNPPLADVFRQREEFDAYLESKGQEGFEYPVLIKGC
ncbi:MAG: hypothetical protein ABMA26_09075 [Limisphaerales bacterium]